MERFGVFFVIISITNKNLSENRFSISLGVNPMTLHTASEYRLGVRGVHREEGVKLDLTLYITTIDKLELTTFKYRYILNLTGHSST